jgi:hypothetical protein
MMMAYEKVETCRCWDKLCKNSLAIKILQVVFDCNFTYIRDLYPIVYIREVMETHTKVKQPNINRHIFFGATAQIGPGPPRV